MRQSKTAFSGSTMLDIERVTKLALERPVVLLGASQEGGPIVCTLEAYEALGGRGGEIIDAATAAALTETLPYTVEDVLNRQ